MNTRFTSLLSLLVLIVAMTVTDGSQDQGQNKSSEKFVEKTEEAVEQRPGRVTRVHRDKDKRQGNGRPAWVAAAVARGRDHLVAVKGEADLEDPEAELVLDSVLEDDLGQTHLRFDQVYQGIPVFGSQVIVELDQVSGNKIFGKADPSVRRLLTKPTISAAAATESATTALGYAGQFASPPTTELVILPSQDGSGAAALTWLVELAIEDGTEATARHRYFVSAHDGGVVMHYDALPQATGASYYSGNVSIGTTYALLNDGKYLYRLWDKTRATYTTDMRHSTSDTDTGGVFSNATDVWGNTSPYRETAAVDAHFGVTKAWDYFRQRQGWTGINGAGEGVISRVHYGAGWANAKSWNGVLTFGDGDSVGTRAWVSVDIVAHEYTHAVIERTANLVYSYQSGALNESFADIFGTAVEFYTGIRPDYLIGEDFGIQQQALRNMAHPPQYGHPDHASRYVVTTDDNGGVHINSGIPNKAFYLLAVGGTHPLSGITVPRIGRAAAEWIFFRALRKLPKNASFSQARVAALSAAADGYGLYSSAWNATKAAWDAVGVY